MKVVDRFTEKSSDDTVTYKYRLAIPNAELKTVYKNIIMSWFYDSLTNEAIIPKALDKKGIILEFKRANTNETIEEAANRSLKQINDKHYDEGMRNKGVKDIVKIGVGFKGKVIKVVTD